MYDHTVRRSTSRVFCVAAVFLLTLILQASAEPTPSETLSIERGDSYGRERSFQVTLGDLDGDGDLDAVFANVPDRSEIWMNDGTGHFENSYQYIGSESRGIELGDLDGDGDLDLLTAPVSNTQPSCVFFNNGLGRFTRATYDFGDTTISANLLSLFDVDGDGDLDAGIYYPLSQRQTRLYLNDGSGVLSLVSGFALPGIATWGDVDADGDADAICLQHEQAGRGYKVFLNTGNLGFQEVQHISTASAFFAGVTAMGDLDHDGDLDFVAIGRESGLAPLTVLLNDGSGAFTLAPPSDFVCPSGRITLGDLNEDGAIDVYIGCLDQPPMIGLGDGAGGFVDSRVDLGSTVMSGIAALGDLDGDGDLDIFAPVYGQSSGPNEVWLNHLR